MKRYLLLIICLAGLGLAAEGRVAERTYLTTDRDVYVAGDNDHFNQELEKALRVADFLEIGELMAIDALNRRESCGGHFREEMQTSEGETKRDDENYMYVADWEYKKDEDPALHKEPLKFEYCKVATRNYKD